MGIRHYLYISDTKIDTWLPQVPQASTRKISAELGFNIAVLSGKIGTQRDAKTAPAERVSKCQLLERYIKTNEKVGSCESVGEWIAGTVQARVFPIKHSAVLFVSCLSDETLVLTGSSRHLIGAPRMAGRPRYLAPFGPHVLEMLSAMAEKKLTIWTPAQIESVIEGTVSTVKDPAWVQTLRDFERATKRPLQYVAFLAKRLLPTYQSGEGRRYEVYSPLFVESVAAPFKA
jgi:hypothetical protein